MRRLHSWCTSLESRICLDDMSAELSRTGVFDLTGIFEAARLAPSAHNSQPWQLRVVDHGRAIEIGWQPERALPHGDADNHYLMIGLGCVAESMAIRAAL